MDAYDVWSTGKTRGSCGIPQDPLPPFSGASVLLLPADSRRTHFVQMDGNCVAWSRLRRRSDNVFAEGAGRVLEGRPADVPGALRYGE